MRSQVLISSLLLLPSLGLAQTQAVTPSDTGKATVLKEITVTATRAAHPLFRVPNPVVVLDSARIRRSLAVGFAELMREEPGLDMTGTGTNQGRPEIRGQRGQRILLLEDGIRLNNTRRQQRGSGRRRCAESKWCGGRSRCSTEATRSAAW